MSRFDKILEKMETVIFDNKITTNELDEMLESLQDEAGIND